MSKTSNQKKRLNNRGGAVVLILVVVIVILAAAVVFLVFQLNKKNNNVVQDNITAEGEERKSFTIVNDTGKNINKASVLVDDGAIIFERKYTNEDDGTDMVENISADVPDNYQKYESFKIVLEDLYGTRYVKEIVVKDNRRTTVHVAKEDKN